MTGNEIKIIGEVRAALVHQKFTNYSPVAMDAAIEKLTKLMEDQWTQEMEDLKDLTMTKS